MGRRDERIGAVVTVEHGCLGAFKKNVLSFSDQGLDSVVRIFHIGAELFRISQVINQHLLVVETFHPVKFFQKHVFLLHVVFQFLRKNFFIHKVAHTDTDAVDLVRIARPDPVFRRPQLPAAFSHFFCLVQTDMVGKYDLRTGGNLEMLRVDSLGLQLFHFLKETFRVNNNARTDDTDGTRIHNAARHKAQRISFAAGHNRMSRVVSPLGTDNNVRFCRQVIYNLSFPLIAPLGANDHSCCHYTFSFLLIIQ